MFCWSRSASTAQSQVWLGLPDGRFQFGGSPQITAATARLWSSCGELRAICSKSRKRLSLTRRERRRHPVVALSSTFATWRIYGILRILRSAHMSNASMREHWRLQMMNTDRQTDKLTDEREDDHMITCTPCLRKKTIRNICV